MKIVFATGNRHKASEVGEIIQGHEILSLNDISFTDEIPEPYPTLSGNALHKAQTVFESCKIPCFAEDTGLEVDALAGAPGVKTARFAGPACNDHENMQLLLASLNKGDDRTAQFRTVLAYVTSKGNHLFTGICKGRISLEKRGQKGFGYDPVFVPEGHSKTFAELGENVKNEISHRARAVKAFYDFLLTQK